ncbi:MAG: ATP-binding cassette domain-containing protein [Spirochaetia bacterium]|jgi:molybdate transport system ATP-binding protein|nr:ATP-binding cassette domain-containing protein [Spirochaetia bacterium]
MELKYKAAAGSAEQVLIQMQDCSVGDILSPAIRSLDWRLLPGEAWAVVGPSGGGKEAFADALAGLMPLRPNDGGSYHQALEGGTAIVSFEAAAALLQKERYNDDSDFVEGGVSEGTTVRSFITAALPAGDALQYPEGRGLEAHRAVQDCAVVEFIDRGLKRLSTGECRRALLCRVVVSKPGLIVAVEPYEGLDTATRETLHCMLEALVGAAVRGEAGAPAIVMVDRLDHVPAAFNRVVEFEGGVVNYAGSRKFYEGTRTGQAGLNGTAPLSVVSTMPPGMHPVDEKPAGMDTGNEEPLIELKDVTVAWSGRAVLDRISWTVRRGEHWLVRGPNGSGKTTLLELVTGDNPQAYCNDVRVFGQRRGSGQTIWELRSRIGIVSYRLHLEYRYLEGMALEDVILSGLYDSIGLYTTVSDGERRLARTWLDLAGFAGRGRQQFGQISFGEQRALLVARAAIKLPELLVLDEPCHGLDDAQRYFVMSLLAVIAERGQSTMIHVTHDPDEVQSFETHVLDLLPGRLPMWVVSGLPG